MDNEVKIYEDGLESYPKSKIFLSNFLMLIWIILGTIACYLLNPLFGWIYLLFALLMILVVLRKLVCTNCYYYDKWCSMGWGKLSAIFFKKGKIENFEKSLGLKLAMITYPSLMIIPIILILISIFKDFNFFKIFILVFLFAVSFYSSFVTRKKTCAVCKMKLFCPGCAAK
jgi:hypothetical protein